MKGVDNFVNQVKVFGEDEFDFAEKVCDNDRGWNQVYNKKTVMVYTQDSESGFKIFKARTMFTDISADVLYDVIQDPQYQPTWDKYTIEASTIGQLDSNHDICHYSLRAISPIKNRDFVLQRSWLDKGDVKYICGHSVMHTKYPPSRKFVRGTIYLTVYLIRKLGDNQCQFTYVTYSDPKGKLPVWFINQVTKVVAPRMFKKLHEACLKYPAWKKNNGPEWKPWRNSNQLINVPRVNLADCSDILQEDQEEFDESNVPEGIL